MTKEKEGYRIGNDVLIHGHILDPENWLISCRKLGISAKTLCPKNYKKWQVLGLAKDFIKQEYERKAKAYTEILAEIECAIIDE